MKPQILIRYEPRIIHVSVGERGFTLWKMDKDWELWETWYGDPDMGEEIDVQRLSELIDLEEFISIIEERTSCSPSK